MNINNFEPDPVKSKKSKRNNRKKNKNKDDKEEETVGDIVEPAKPVPEDRMYND